jgi:hypothetical protein
MVPTAASSHFPPAIVNNVLSDIFSFGNPNEPEQDSGLALNTRGTVGPVAVKFNGAIRLAGTAR